MNPRKGISGALKSKFKSVSSANKTILYNIAGSFGVRGVALVVSLFTMPVYTHFFVQQESLGIWYTLLAVLNWVLTFDLGLGNGLRNKLPIAIAQKDKRAMKEYISSTYFGTIGVVLIVGIVGVLIIPKLSWTSIINVKSQSISNDVLVECVYILFVGILLQFIFKIITSILFAIQRSAFVNLLSLITSILTLLMIFFARSGSSADNLLTMSIINVLAANIPYLVATILVFRRSLKGYFPRVSLVTSTRVKEVLNIGITLLILQLVFMIISSTNELLISHLTNPADVVQYQAYNKIFNTVSSLFTLALTPIWSAVTKAAGEKRYSWIKKLNRILLFASAVVFLAEIVLVPFLQGIIDLWLGKKIISQLSQWLRFCLFCSMFSLSYIMLIQASEMECHSSKFK